MRSSIFLLSLVLVSNSAMAAPPPVSWEITGTSTTPIPEPFVTHRIEHRLFTKTDHLLLRAGFAYLSRADFYSNPGIGLEASWYPLEPLAIDLCGTIFLSTLTETAEDIRLTTGRLPDSQKPAARIVTGIRFAFAYGKLLLEEFDVIIHMDAALTAHAGVLITDKATNLAGDLGLALQAIVAEQFFIWFEVAALMSYEKRTKSSFASGPLGTIGIGILL